MATITFTNKELETLLWAIQNEYGKEVLRLIEEGKTPYKDATVKRLKAINNKVYYTLVEEENK